jgi:plastocyanin
VLIKLAPSPEESGLKTLSIAAALLLTLSLVACRVDDPENDSGNADSPAPAMAPAAPAVSDTDPKSGDVTNVIVNMHDPVSSGRYAFEPNEFKFSRGETVEFTITTENPVFHTFTVVDLGIDIAIDGGDIGTLTFTFDRPGEYKLICIPHKDRGMVGAILVE